MVPRRTFNIHGISQYHKRFIGLLKCSSLAQVYTFKTKGSLLATSTSVESFHCMIDSLDSHIPIYSFHNKGSLLASMIPRRILTIHRTIPFYKRFIRLLQCSSHIPIYTFKTLLKIQIYEEPQIFMETYSSWNVVRYIMFFTCFNLYFFFNKEIFIYGFMKNISRQPFHSSTKVFFFLINCKDIILYETKNTTNTLSFA